MDKISIILPAYNAEKYIKESIQSVLNQTYKNWELIIIDDGSLSDETLKIAYKMQSKDQRIDVYSNNGNKGVAWTRNYGIEISNGDWIAFLDSDDVWNNEKLQKQITFAKKEQVDFIFTGVNFINKDSEFYSRGFEVPNCIQYKDLLKQNVISCSSVLIKKDLIKSYKMQNGEIHEDYALWLQILKNNNIAYGLNEELLTYRILSDSKSGNKLKSVLMTLRTYRVSGLNWLQSMYYLSWYIIKSLKKYHTIKT